MKKAKIVHISKLDAALRQLEAAIHMFFNHGDIVAIHTLAAASHQVLSDLLKKQGPPDGIIHYMGEIEVIWEDKKVAYKNILRKPQNFFKHSNVPGEEKAALEFTPDFTEVWLYDACSLYRQLTQENRPLFTLFGMWFTVNNSEIFDPNRKGVTEFLEAAKQKGMRAGDRASFYSFLPEIYSSIQK